jgi:preprotein translocase subunit SecF
MSRAGRNGDRGPERNGDGALEDEAALDLEEAFEEELEFAEERESDDGAKRPNAFVRLYRGETSFDFIGNRKWWFTISAIIIVAGLISLGTRGLNLGIDFRGGQSWLVSSQNLTVQQATSAVEGAGVANPTVVQLTNHLNGQKQIQVTLDLNSKSQADKQALETKVQDALAAAAHTNPNNVNFNEVGSTWGSQVTHRAVEALIVFFVAVALYISIRFEFKMAIAAIIAVIHDILVVVGIYSLGRFLVTPDTVVAVLTVLGYSLYDTVVVFDRIRENAKGLGASGRITYSEMVNLSMNQTLARSINTSLVAIIPVFSVLVIGSYFLGASTLQSFGLALVIGLTSGAYSSIFIASPLLAMMKEREPRYVTIRQRVEARTERYGILTPAAAAAMAGGGGRNIGRSKKQQRTGVIKPGAAAAARRGGSKGAPAGVATSGAAPSGTSASGNASSGSGTRGSARSGTSAPGSGTTRPGGKRPPPRPRKGKGKGRRR